MGTFYVPCTVVNPSERRREERVAKLLVDTGSEYTWIAQVTLGKIGIRPEKKDVLFQMANGQALSRTIGFAILHIEGYFTIDEVVFAQPGDLQLLGARTLEGLNLTVDSRRKKLVAAGPILAA